MLHSKSDRYPLFGANYLKVICSINFLVRKERKKIYSSKKNDKKPYYGAQTSCET